ncbi:DgyrCDS14481 [Dimorphilus gyrociliatus]|uniref:DgyrCDS14481 n=1 Tax=Dimorphilus gyrociliatus TaxID=2664684 RepID=A0A7I8WE23_9ANNE|nr:DgyrCDS14481 [Dimorphilus gyrociliatus]
MWSLSNIAKNKLSTLSSYYESSDPGTAVDGETNWLHGQNGIKCAHTFTNRHPWWKVDLVKQSQILAVTIIGRGEHADRLENLRIAISSEDVTPTPEIPVECGYYNGPLPPYLTMRCPKSTIGRYLSAVIVAEHTALILCELDIFGYNLDENLKVNTIFYNQTDYFYRINNQTKDCNGNLKSTSDISEYQISSSFEIVLKGIDIENQSFYCNICCDMSMKKCRVKLQRLPSSAAVNAEITQTSNFQLWLTEQGISNNINKEQLLELISQLNGNHEIINFNNTMKSIRKNDTNFNEMVRSFTEIGVNPGKEEIINLRKFNNQL